MTRFSHDLFRTLAASALLAVLGTGAVRADECALVSGERDIWDHEGSVVHVEAFRFVAVVRFDSTQRMTVAGAVPKRWVDDVPSDTMGVQAICDRVQLESPVPLQGDADTRIVMMQGERLRSDTEMSAFPDLSARIAEQDRLIVVPAGRVFVSAVQLDADEWRSTLLAKATAQGAIDPDRWMIGLPGGLYLVPLK